MKICFAYVVLGGHSGEGWYYWKSDEMLQGSSGAFELLHEAIEHAERFRSSFKVEMVRSWDSEGYELLLELDSGQELIKPEHQASVVSHPAEECAPRRLKIGKLLSESFLITSIMVQCQGVLVGGPLPAALMVEARLPPMVAHGGVKFVVEVENVSHEPQRFRAEVWGQLP